MCAVALPPRASCRPVSRDAPDQWFSIFLMLCDSLILFHGVVIPNHKVILLLLHNCNFATVTKYKFDICYGGLSDM